MASADNEAALRSWGVDADALNNNQQIVVTAEEDMMLRQVSVHPSLLSFIANDSRCLCSACALRTAASSIYKTTRRKTQRRSPFCATLQTEIANNR